MSKLKELIDRLCPDGVEYKPLGEVAKIMNGKDYKHLDNGDIPVYGSGGVMTFINDFMYDGESVLLPRKGSIGKLYYVNDKFWTVDTIYWTRINLDILKPKFLYYFLQTQNIENRAIKAGAVPSMTQAIYNKILIPVPPKEVQEEIVKILDRFADYAAELQAELQARKEQYEYYRNLLLTFNPSAYGCGTDDEQENKNVTTPPTSSYEILWKTLGEIGTFIRGNGLQKKDFTESGVGCIHYGQIYTHYGTFATETKSFVSHELANKLLSIHPGNLVIACTSENVEDVGKAVAWLGDKDIVTGGHSVVFRHNQNPKYIAYFFQTQYFFVQKKKYAYGAKVIDIRTDDLSKIRIPIPPLEIQEKIVSILDRFETLVNDLTLGLPAEIEAVKDRYEYYRNRLLTFKELA